MLLGPVQLVVFGLQNDQMKGDVALSAAVTLFMGARGAGVPPSTVQTGEAGRGVFSSRSCRKEGQRPLPASHLGRSVCKLPALF